MRRTMTNLHFGGLEEYKIFHKNLTSQNYLPSSSSSSCRRTSTLTLPSKTILDYCVGGISHMVSPIYVELENVWNLTQY